MPEWVTQAYEEPDTREWSIVRASRASPGLHWLPGWATARSAGAWGIVRAAMIAGLDHREVGLGPSRVADGFLE